MLRRRRRQQQRTVISKFTAKQIHSFLTKNNEEKRDDKTATLDAHANSSGVFFLCSLSLLLLFFCLRKS